MYIHRTVLFSLIFLIGQHLYSQNKPGYFDYSKVEKALPVFAKMEDYMKAFEKHLNDSLTILQNNSQNEFVGHGCGVRMDSATKANKEAVLNKLNDDISRFKASAQERYFKESEKLWSEMKNKVILIIKEFCFAKKIEVMAEKEAMIYCPDCKDYTDEIIEHINSDNIK